MRAKCVSLLAFLFVLFASWSAFAFEVPPDSAPDPSEVQDRFHLYVDNSFSAFNNVFDLWITDGVEADWDSTTIAQFIALVMDDDSTNSDDVFPHIWDYFCFNDQDMSYAGVRFTIGVTEYTKILIYLYHQGDFTCPPDHPYYCKGYGWYRSGTNEFMLPMTRKQQGVIVIRGVDDIANYGFAHELQHLCYRVNGRTGGGYPNEALSMCAEYLRQAWAWHWTDFDTHTTLASGIQRIVILT